MTNDSTHDGSGKSNSTSNSSRKNDSNSNKSKTINPTSNRLLNSDSTSNSRSEQFNDSTYYNLSDHKNICDFIDTRKTKIISDKKDISKMNSILAKSRILGDKLYEGTTNPKDKRQYVTVINK